MVPWRELCALVEPHYPKPGNRRPPVGMERMPRIYFLQQWFNLSDPAVEESLYDSAGMRQFVGVIWAARRCRSYCGLSLRWRLRGFLRCCSDSILESKLSGLSPSNGQGVSKGDNSRMESNRASDLSASIHNSPPLVTV